jgi:hypothetical protein
MIMLYKMIYTSMITLSTQWKKEQPKLARI